MQILRHSRWFTKASHVAGFLGTRVCRLMLFSTCAAVLMSLAELGFAILIQSFLVAMGIVPTVATQLPKWAPTSLLLCLASLFSFALLRGLLQAFKLFSSSMTLEAFSIYMKEIIMRWSLLFGKSNSSDVVTLANDRVASTANLIAAYQISIIHILTGTLIVVYLMVLSWKLAILGISLLLIFGTSLRLFDKKVSAAGHGLVTETALLNSRFLDSLRNLQYLRVVRFEEFEIRSLVQILSRHYSAMRSYAGIHGFKNAAPQVAGVLLVVVLSLVSKKNGVLVGGAFLSFIYLFVRLSQIASEFSGCLTVIKMHRPQLAILFEWYENAYPELQRTEKNIAVKKNMTQYHRAPIGWELQDLTVAYDQGRPILRAFNAQIKPGSIVILRGSSGSGKSTLFFVLAGLIRAQCGTLLVNGRAQDIEERIRSGELRLGYMGAEPAIISGTILNNLLYGVLDPVTEEQIRAVLTQTDCLGFVNENELGLDRPISDRGDGLSTGQKQRLALARAILGNPCALLLDEPSANLDEKSKAAIKRAILGLRGKITVVIATHDGSLSEIADQIIEIGNDGRAGF